LFSSAEFKFFLQNIYQNCLTAQFIQAIAADKKGLSDIDDLAEHSQWIKSLLQFGWPLEDENTSDWLGAIQKQNRLAMVAAAGGSMMNYITNEDYKKQLDRCCCLLCHVNQKCFYPRHSIPIPCVLIRVIVEKQGASGWTIYVDDLVVGQLSNKGVCTVWLNQVNTR